MAKLNVTGIEQTIKSLEQMGEHIGPVADAMLTAAGKEVVKGWQFSAAKNNHFRTGAMYDSIKMTPPKTAKGERVVIVSPTGTDKHNRRKAVRNEEKGFVLNYGRENMPGSHWADEGDEMSEGPAVNAMETVFDDFIQTGKTPNGTATASGPWVVGRPSGAATFHQE